jgi:hypothetical protein
MNGVVSSLVRLDCTVQSASGNPLDLTIRDGKFVGGEGTVKPFELEGRPDGLDVISALSPEFLRRLLRATHRYPRIRLVLGPGRQTDDHLWLPPQLITHGPHVPDDNSLVIVRADPGDRDYHHLSRRSLCPVITEERKDYAEGYWYEFVQTPEDLPARGRHVLKRTVSSRSEGLLIGDAGDPAFRAHLAAHPDGMYLQPYWHRMRLADGRIVLRVVWMFNPLTGSWECLGGAWGLRYDDEPIHGSPDTIFGPAVMV